MARKAAKKEKSSEKVETGAPAGGLGRLELARSNPFAAMRRLSDEMERRFHGLGFGDLRPPRLWRDLDHSDVWGPDVDMLEKKGQVVVRADLPGLSKEDVKVEITDTALTIEGERRSEQEEEKDGYYRSERSYGSFRRTIPLPEGVKADRAKATYRDGVLEITMPTGSSRKKKSGRRLQIKA